MSDQTNINLQVQLDKWLSQEGYPLEYYAAGAFRSAGFDVRQGMHGRGERDGNPREIDVVAQLQRDCGAHFIRLENIVECKWSQDKPWVVFTSPRAHIMRSACIAQTISSHLGDALLWTLIGKSELQSLQLFSSPGQPGFGGRQAFAKNDLFYGSLASVTGACVSAIKEIDGRKASPRHLPRPCVITFPIIVVDGRLFEARYDADQDELQTHEVDHVRCHWSGSPAWPLFATVDIVARSSLPEFAVRRRADFDILMTYLRERLENLAVAFAAKDPTRLNFDPGATGRGSLPFLLRHLRDIAGEANPDPTP